MPGISKPLPPVPGSSGLPGRASLRRVLRVRCPHTSIGDLSTYPEGSSCEFRRCSHSNFSVNLRCPSVPFRPANRPEKPIQWDKWSHWLRLPPAGFGGMWSRRSLNLTFLTAVWRKLGEFTMGRLLSRIAASHSTGSNRRTSHVDPYFTQLRALMCFFRSVRAHPLPIAASAYPQHGRCAFGLRRGQDVSRLAAPVCRGTRRVQYG